MEEAVVKQLLDINERFYQRFGSAFAETRRRLQPGVQRVMQSWMKNGDWLDIGCGSGTLGRQLAQSGFKGSYLGLDFSTPLLAEARRVCSEVPTAPEFQIHFETANLLDARWMDAAGRNLFDGVLSFAVLHHIPAEDQRARLVRQILDLLKPGGLFIHSEWQFQHQPKLAARVQPWSHAGLEDTQVEAGDVLLDWRHYAPGQEEEPGLRYVHQFSRPELADLIGGRGFHLLEEFDSDGATGNLGLYQVWRKLS